MSSDTIQANSGIVVDPSETTTTTTTASDSVYLFLLAGQTFSADQVANTLTQISSSKRALAIRPMRRLDVARTGQTAF